ncbi:MAG: hypothetical protein VKI93_03215 [Synechococcus sp.]|nr:hypothetical protein [Synechococcus sp.]
MGDSSDVVPQTALIIDGDGRLTYTGVDGIRRVIVSDPDLLRRLRQLQGSDDEASGGCGI